MKKLLLALTLIAVSAIQINASQALSNRDRLLNEVALILSELATLGAPVNDSNDEISSMDEVELSKTLDDLKNYKQRQLALINVYAQDAELERQAAELTTAAYASAATPAPAKKSWWKKLIGKE